MFKEAKIIIPATIACDEYEQTMLNKWNGFTKVKASGNFRGKDRTYIEEVYIYYIAMEDKEGNCLGLRNLAARIAFAEKEECVYIKYPDGRVYLINRAGFNVAL